MKQQFGVSSPPCYFLIELFLKSFKIKASVAFASFGKPV